MYVTSTKLPLSQPIGSMGNMLVFYKGTMKLDTYVQA